jgi:hypothetical protein
MVSQKQIKDELLGITVSLDSENEPRVFMSKKVLLCGLCSLILSLIGIFLLFFSLVSRY